ncbi:MAG TPA: magnesium chelatase domain-containing protein, partial [Methanospirillum sp.]|nr:magnesium chelatase domain-containing protein [Methanospirillum sp.]
MGSDAGSVLPIMAAITPAQGDGGNIIATGLLKEIAQESIKNVGAILKRFTGKDIRNIDIHIQFIGTYQGVEGDSASITVATAAISALESIPVRQDIAMTGSLSVRGDVLPVGGVTYKIEAAARAGIRKVLIPKANLGDVLIEDEFVSAIEIIPVEKIDEVLKIALVPDNKELFLDKLKTIAWSTTRSILGTDIPAPRTVV